MRQLVLYSDQIVPANQHVDHHLLRVLGSGSARIGYIASSSDPERRFFVSRQRYYAQYRLDLALYVELDDAYDPALLDPLFACDAIHLSGGNTYYFLYWLQQRGLVKRLHYYAEHVGVLVGTSAGAILMTPNISSAALCGDTPYGLLSDAVGLNLVDFAFVPHAQDDAATLHQMHQYAQHHQQLLYGCHDGDGIIVVGDTVTLVGDVITVKPSATERTGQDGTY